MSLVKCWYHYFLDRQASNNFAAYLFLSYIGSILATSWFQAGCHPPRSEIEKKLLSWGTEVLEQIEEVSIDMWKGYKSLVLELMPKAQVVADRFHVMVQINQELDSQRKQEKPN